MTNWKKNKRNIGRNLNNIFWDNERETSNTHSFTLNWNVAIQDRWIIMDCWRGKISLLKTTEVIGMDSLSTHFSISGQGVFFLVLNHHNQTYDGTGTKRSRPLWNDDNRSQQERKNHPDEESILVFVQLSFHTSEDDLGLDFPRLLARAEAATGPRFGALGLSCTARNVAVNAPWNQINKSN